MIKTQFVSVRRRGGIHLFTFSDKSFLRAPDAAGPLCVQAGVQGGGGQGGQVPVVPHQGALSAEPATPAAARVTGKV